MVFVREVVFLIIRNWQPFRDVSNNQAVLWSWLVERNRIYKGRPYSVLVHSALLRGEVMHVEAKRSYEYQDEEDENDVFNPFHI